MEQGDKPGLSGWVLGKIARVSKREGQKEMMWKSDRNEIFEDRRRILPLPSQGLQF